MSETTNSPQPFDIHGFDADQLKFEDIISAVSAYDADLNDSQQHGQWTVTQIVDHDSKRLFRLDPEDAETFPSLGVKLYIDDPKNAIRTYHVLVALNDDFGVSTGPRPFFAKESAEGVTGGVLVREWIQGDPMEKLPSTNDDEMWQRMMAVTGVQKNLPFGKYASQIPMRGTGIQQPRDLFQWIDDSLERLDEDHELHQKLTNMVRGAKDIIVSEWSAMPKIAMSRLDPDFSHFIWDGYHLRGVGWSKVDWADVAFDIAQMAADPDYEDLPPSHWVWLRWEYGRMTHDDSMVSRSTTYTQLLHLYWTMELTHRLESMEDGKPKRRLTKQRDRYLKRAQKHFG